MNINSLDDIEFWRYLLEGTLDIRVEVADANPEDADLCLAVRRALEHTRGAQLLSRFDRSVAGFDPAVADVWDALVAETVEVLLVVATGCPSAKAQGEIIAALCAGKTVQMILPKGAELPAELQTILGYLGDVRTKRWNGASPRSESLPATIADLFYTGPYLVSCIPTVVWCHFNARDNFPRRLAA
jgi:hypothetical protein